MKKPLLERAAVSYFQSRSERVPRPKVGDEVDAVHLLNAHEQEAIKRVERGAIARAAIAGAISAGICAVAELVADPYLPEGAPLFSSATYWVILGGATLAAAVVEIAFLYWDTLRSMHQLALACIIDGRFTARENQLWRDAQVASGSRVDFAPVEALRVAFARGDPRLEGLLSAVREPAQ